MNTTTTTNVMGDTFKTLSDSYAKTFNMGVKFFDETGRFWTETMNRSADDYRNRCEKMFDEMNTTGKKNVERFTRFFEEQTSRNMNFFKAITDVTPMNTPTEFVDRSTAVVRTSFETMRDSFDGASKCMTETMQAGATIVRNNDTTEAAAKKPVTK